MGFPGGSAGKESACNAGDLGSIPGLGRSPGEGNSYPLQYSGLEKSMDCIVHGILQVRILEWAAIPFSRGSSQPRDWTQVSHMGLPYYRQIHYQLNHQRSPRILERVTYPFSRGFFLTQEWTGVTCIAGGFFTSWATREAPPPFFCFGLNFV